jgi:hypothetical protein
VSTSILVNIAVLIFGRKLESAAEGGFDTAPSPVRSLEPWPSDAEQSEAAMPRSSSKLTPDAWYNQLYFGDNLRILFCDDPSGNPKRGIVSVKSGKLGVGMVRDLVGVLTREKAPLGILVTLEEPTRPMLTEAATAGFYQPTHLPGQRYPRVQILTIAELLRGKRAEHPRLGMSTLPAAPRRRKETGKQQEIDWAAGG